MLFNSWPQKTNDICHAILCPLPYIVATLPSAEVFLEAESQVNWQPLAMAHFLMSTTPFVLRVCRGGVGVSVQCDRSRNLKGENYECRKLGRIEGFNVGRAVVLLAHTIGLGGRDIDIECRNSLVTRFFKYFEHLQMSNKGTMTIIFESA